MWLAPETSFLLKNTIALNYGEETWLKQLLRNVGWKIRVEGKLILHIDKITSICKAFYFSTDRKESSEVITMQNWS